jgi:glycosyltransferase involved in cell wall biosynthesis
MKKISIVTVTLNNFNNIEQTIKSVLDQHYLNLEYIVIDGGSSDGTVEILNKYKDRFKYFESCLDNGVYDAMNKGILKASGDLIGFVNGGDFLYQDSLIETSKIFSQQKSDYFFSVADIDYIDNNNKIIGSKICLSNDQIYKKRFIEMPANHLAIFVPLKAFKQFGLFDLRFKYRADYHFILKLMKYQYKPLKLKKKIGAFRIGGISGGYLTYLENYKVITSLNENEIIAIYSSLRGVFKLFIYRIFNQILNFFLK